MTKEFVSCGHTTRFCGLITTAGWNRDSEHEGRCHLHKSSLHHRENRTRVKHSPLRRPILETWKTCGMIPLFGPPLSFETAVFEISTSVTARTELTKTPVRTVNIFKPFENFSSSFGGGTRLTDSIVLFIPPLTPTSATPSVAWAPINENVEGFLQLR